MRRMSTSIIIEKSVDQRDRKCQLFGSELFTKSLTRGEWVFEKLYFFAYTEIVTLCQIGWLLKLFNNLNHPPILGQGTLLYNALHFLNKHSRENRFARPFVLRLERPWKYSRRFEIAEYRTMRLLQSDWTRKSSKSLAQLEPSWRFVVIPRSDHGVILSGCIVLTTNENDNGSRMRLSRIRATYDSAVVI